MGSSNFPLINNFIGHFNIRVFKLGHKVMSFTGWSCRKPAQPYRALSTTRSCPSSRTAKKKNASWKPHTSQAPGVDWVALPLRIALFKVSNLKFSDMDIDRKMLMVRKGKIGNPHHLTSDKQNPTKRVSVRIAKPPTWWRLKLFPPAVHHKRRAASKYSKIKLNNKCYKYGLAEPCPQVRKCHSIYSIKIEWTFFCIKKRRHAARD